MKNYDTKHKKKKTKEKPHRTCKVRVRNFKRMLEKLSYHIYAILKLPIL